jgi:hypothetical protein
MAQIDGHRIGVNLPVLRCDDLSNTYIPTGFDSDLAKANFTPVLRRHDFWKKYSSKFDSELSKAILLLSTKFPALFSKAIIAWMTSHQIFLGETHRKTHPQS